VLSRLGRNLMCRLPLNVQPLQAVSLPTAPSFAVALGTVEIWLESRPPSDFRH